MEETGSGIVLHQTEVEKIAYIFKKYYEDWKNGNYSFKPDTELIKSYERKEAAGKLSVLLNNLIKNKNHKI
jgi:hypothetical protein